jgi:hypothetical protein
MNKIGDIAPYDFKLYYKAILNKNVWHLDKNSHMDEWKEKCRTLRYNFIFLERAQKIQNLEMIVSSINGVWKT